MKSMMMETMTEVDGIMRDEDHAESELGVRLAKPCVHTSTFQLLPALVFSTKVVSALRQI